MKIIKQIAGIIMILAFLTGCEKKTDLNRDLVNQRILFQHEYLNNAWGHQQFGWLIDSSGIVYCYKLPEKWIDCDSLGKISDSSMNSNISGATSLCLRLDRTELNGKADMIKKASNGELTKPQHEMFDSGISSYYGFIYDSKNNSYQRILIKQTGDFRIENKTQAAVDLYNWLETIDKKVRNIE